MKKQKGSLLQRMLAVLLAAVLVVGMTSNAVPMTVLAQGSVSENTSEPVEGETKPAQGEDSGDQKDPEMAEGEEETDPEGQSRRKERNRRRRSRITGPGRKRRNRAWRKKKSRRLSAKMMQSRNLW